MKLVPLACLVAAPAAPAAPAVSQEFCDHPVSLESSELGGAPPNGYAHLAAASDDGLRIACTSVASNVVPGDTNGKRDVFLRDVALDTTVRVSAGLPAVQRCRSAQVSGTATPPRRTGAVPT